MANLFGLLFSLLTNLKQKIYFISGPTAIGKSSLALRIAKKNNGIIINADSMQVYSNLEILTARPNKSDLDQINHKLYGYVDASIRYNVAKWISDTLKVIENNEVNNRVSIIVGGTGMYIDSILSGLIDLPNIPEEYKKKSEDFLNTIGIEKFIKTVGEIDPIAIKNISTNDTTRLRRIWEVYKCTGETYSFWKNKKNKIFLKNFSHKLFLFIPPKDKIYKNVNLRFKDMIKQGAIEEVKKLIKLNLDKSLPLMRAHGVPEISSYLENKTSLEEAIYKGQQVTRNYVKRQLTWWRSSSLPIHQVFNEFPKEIDENLIKMMI